MHHDNRYLKPPQLQRGSFLPKATRSSSERRERRPHLCGLGLKVGDQTATRSGGFSGRGLGLN